MSTVVVVVNAPFCWDGWDPLAETVWGFAMRSGGLKASVQPLLSFGMFVWAGQMLW